jgi:hypothetical protein
LLSIEVQNVTIYGGIDGTVKLGFLEALLLFLFLEMMYNNKLDT